MAIKPTISIIIPTRNAAPLLEECLKSIKLQNYPSTEIIIADNYSTDETRKLGKKYGGKVILGGPPPPFNDFFTAPIQRRKGAKIASGDFLFFIDADMTFEKGLFEDCVKRSINGADAVMIPEISFGQGYWSRCKISERAYYFNRHFGDKNIQAARFFKKSVYEKTGGWDEEVGGLDDWEITARLQTLGFKLSLSNHHIFHNEGRLTLRRLVLKKYSMGKAARPSQYLSSGGKSFRLILEQLTPFRILTLMRWLPKINKNISEIFGVALMKVVEGLSFYLGLAVSKLLISKKEYSNE